MPELPEVETTRRGLVDALVGQRIHAVKIRRRDLRFPIPEQVDRLAGTRISDLQRRGKYLIAAVDGAHLLIHLGMSGSLRLVAEDDPWRTHDHWGLSLANGRQLRYHDPRRFGCLLWLDGDPLQHALLARLGPEPLGSDFHPAYLYRHSRGRSVSIKSFIMDAQVVVGIGNIYAQEALFQARIRPQRVAGSLSRGACERLHQALCDQLESALRAGGSSLRDYVNGQGEPGYFQLSLAVYGRGGQACMLCQRPLQSIRLNGRSTVYCRHCQR